MCIRYGCRTERYQVLSRTGDIIAAEKGCNVRVSRPTSRSTIQTCALSPHGTTNDWQVQSLLLQVQPLLPNAAKLVEHAHTLLQLRASTLYRILQLYCSYHHTAFTEEAAVNRRLLALYLAVNDDLSREGAPIQIKIVIAQAVLHRHHTVWEAARHLRSGSTAEQKLKMFSESRRYIIFHTREFQLTLLAYLYRGL